MTGRSVSHAILRPAPDYSTRVSISRKRYLLLKANVAAKAKAFLVAVSLAVVSLAVAGAMAVEVVAAVPAPSAAAVAGEEAGAAADVVAMRRAPAQPQHF